MSYIEGLEDKINDYTSDDYEIIETTVIPSPENVAFGKKAYRIQLTAFCIDLRKSTDLLKVHDKETCGKIHKSFLAIVAKIITENGGQLRSFNGDSVLAFFPAQLKSELENAVRTAFQLKWALDIKFSKYFEQFSKLDFCIGIDWGDVLIVRAGLPKNDNNNDLVFLGMCVNYATAIANQGYGPKHIEISNSLYSNLTDSWIYGTSNGVKKNMWTDGKVNWKGQVHDSKCSSWYQEIQE
jgi:class 3 adenylate cyclase